MDFDSETLNRLFHAGQNEREVKTVILENGDEVFLVPEGYSVERAPPIERPLPKSIHQTVTFDTDASFIDYVETFKNDAESRLFVSRDKAVMTVVFDYHSFGAVPARLAHRALYRMPWSPQWKRWTSLASRPVNQKMFMEFIEENGEDIRNPSAADLMQMIARVQSKKSTEFTSGLRLSDGSMEISYKEEVENSGGALKTATLPSEITIGVPVFLDGPAYEVKVFIRYHIDGGKLAFQVVLNRAEFVIEDAMKVAVDHVSGDTDLTAYWGELVG